MQSLVDTFNDILDIRNRDSWSNLDEESALDSEQMLQYAEDCALYMGSFLNKSTQSVLISKPNIG